MFISAATYLWGSVVVGVMDSFAHYTTLKNRHVSPLYVLYGLSVSTAWLLLSIYVVFAAEEGFPRWLPGFYIAVFVLTLLFSKSSVGQNENYIPWEIQGHPYKVPVALFNFCALGSLAFAVLALFAILGTDLSPATLP